MKTLISLIFFSLFISSAYAAGECQLELANSIIQTEDKLPAWDPKLNKTRLMRMTLKEFSTPAPDAIRIQIPSTGNCKHLVVQSVKLYLQLGPEDFGEDSKHTHDHSRPKKGIHWENKAFDKVTPKFEITTGSIVLKNIPAAVPLEGSAEGQHVWAIKYQVDYKSNGKSHSEHLIIEAPLAH